jgi:hypothetical protein
MNNWAELTAREPDEIAHYAMMFIGAVWSVKAAGAVDDPDSPEHRGKTVREVHGSYTLGQLQEYLHKFVDKTHILEDVLIAGLINAIDRELESHINDYHQGVRRNLDFAKDQWEMSQHPENYPQEYFEELKEVWAPRFGNNIDVKQMLAEGAAFAYMMADRPPDQFAQMKSMLAAWREVAKPLITTEHLNTWSADYFKEMSMRSFEQQRKRQKGK